MKTTLEAIKAAQVRELQLAELQRQLDRAKSELATLESLSQWGDASHRFGIQHSRQLIAKLEAAIKKAKTFNLSMMQAGVAAAKTVMERANPTRPFDILINGRVQMTLWATDKADAIRQAKQQGLRGTVGASLTAYARIQDEEVVS